MTVLFFILIIITCVVLAFFVLIQNPKGGGLAGNMSGIGTQMMGAKQSTDIVEKGTWIASAVLLAFVILSFVMKPATVNNPNEKTRAEKTNTGVSIPAAAPAQEPAQQATPQSGATPMPAPANGTTPAPAPQGNATPAPAPAPAK